MDSTTHKLSREFIFFSDRNFLLSVCSSAVKNLPGLRADYLHLKHIPAKEIAYRVVKSPCPTKKMFVKLLSPERKIYLWLGDAHIVYNRPFDHAIGISVSIGEIPEDGLNDSKYDVTKKSTVVKMEFLSDESRRDYTSGVLTWAVGYEEVGNVILDAIEAYNKLVESDRQQEELKAQEWENIKRLASAVPELKEAVSRFETDQIGSTTPEPQQNDRSSRIELRTVYAYCRWLLGYSDKEIIEDWERLYALEKKRKAADDQVDAIEAIEAARKRMKKKYEIDRPKDAA